MTDPNLIDKLKEIESILKKATLPMGNVCVELHFSSYTKALALLNQCIAEAEKDNVHCTNCKYEDEPVRHGRCFACANGKIEDYWQPK